MGQQRLKELDDFFYRTLIEAMKEWELEFANDEEYEKAAIIRDQVEQLIKDASNIIYSS